MGFLTPQATGERDVIAAFVLHQLQQLRSTVHGLTDDQANSSPSASELSLTGLLRHCAGVTVYWSGAAASAPRPPTLPEGFTEDQEVLALVEDDQPLAQALAVFDRAVEITEQNLLGTTDLSAPVPVPEAPWYPADLVSWEARWALAHLSHEIARHAGHADIIRESIDGKGSYELNDLADGHTTT